IERAGKLMLFSEMNISEIAAYYGFESIHYFSRLFRQLTGKSPSEYLRDHSKPQVSQFTKPK
ncbi:MAG: helix-turn-helix domain-containing protein, partial [Victivallales bacterium]|nr:helix-turn-helix domain-containing protein [Victivallales bacterium]